MNYLIHNYLLSSQVDHVFLHKNKTLENHLMYLYEIRVYATSAILDCSNRSLMTIWKLLRR